MLTIYDFFGWLAVATYVTYVAERAECPVGLSWIFGGMLGVLGAGAVHVVMRLGWAVWPFGATVVGLGGASYCARYRPLDRWLKRRAAARAAIAAQQQAAEKLVDRMLNEPYEDLAQRNTK